MTQVHIPHWDHYIWQTWINHLCKSGLDPINCKSSFTILFELAPMRESSLLSLLWAQGVTMSVCITLTKSADPNWVCPALLRSCWVYALGQAEFRIETQPANSYKMVEIMVSGHSQSLIKIVWNMFHQSKIYQNLNSLRIVLRVLQHFCERISSDGSEINLKFNIGIVSQVFYPV